MSFKRSCLLIAAQYLVLVAAQDHHQFTCGSDRPQSCISSPSNCNPQTCQLVADVERKNENTFTFQLQGKVSRDSYVAIGLSKDDTMGQDAVVACYSNEIHTYVNPEGHTPSKKTDWSIGAPSNGVSANADDRISCSFDLPSKIDAGQGISLDLNAPNKINIFLASGSVRNMMIQQHTSIPVKLEVMLSSLTTKKPDASIVGPASPNSIPNSNPGNGSSSPSKASIRGSDSLCLTIYSSLAVVALTLLKNAF